MVVYMRATGLWLMESVLDKDLESLPNLSGNTMKEIG